MSFPNPYSSIAQLSSSSIPPEQLLQSLQLFPLNFPPLLNFRYPLAASTAENSPLRTKILEELGDSHFYWDYEAPKQQKPENYFPFKLPKSNFEGNDAIECINLPQYKFHSERERLNEQQLREIWRNRSFRVISEINNLPHLWRISNWLLHSSQERMLFLKKTLAICLRLFYAIPNVINPCSGRVIRVDCKESLLRPNIFNVFVNFIAFFLNLWDFFLGFKFRTLPQNYEELANKNVYNKEFLNLSKNYEKLRDNSSIARFMKKLGDEIEKNKGIAGLSEANLLENERRFKSLMGIEDRFNKIFEAETWEEINKEDFNEEEIQALKEAIYSTKQEKLLEFLKNLSIIEPDPFYQVLLNKLKAKEIYQVLLEAKNERIATERKKISDFISKERPIYSLIGYKRERLIQSRLSPIEKALEKEFLITVENQLADNHLEEELFLFRNHFQYQINFPSLLSTEIKEMRRHLLEPVNKFTIKFPLFPSQYKILPNFLIKTEGEITIYSNFLCYKVVKAFSAYFLKFYSLNFKIIRWIWQGPFGLKCLISFSEFFTEYSVGENGEIVKNKGKIRPILRSFLGVIHGIQKSRRNFENAPDDGFFGKNFGRFLNIFYCFFVRFLFAGVLIVLLIHPIINIFCILGGILALVTAFLWLMVVEVFLLAWKFLIYDYKSTLRHHSWRFYDKSLNFYEYSHLKLLRSYKYFTLLHLIWDFLINVLIQFLMVVLMVIIAPVLSLCTFIIGLSLFILKSFWDCLILNIIIRFLARVPSSNSSVAYRVSGPGISRDFYNTLENKDLSILILAFLEKLQLEQIYKEGCLILKYPETFIKKKYNNLLKGLIQENFTNEFLTQTFKNLGFLQNSLRFRVDEGIKRLPSIRGGNSTIRFTAEELEKNEILIESLLREFVERENLDRFIWERYQLRKGLYKRLTRKVLQEVLNPEVIKPVEQIDRIERVKFSNKTNNINDFIEKFVDEKGNSSLLKEKRVYLHKLKKKGDGNKGKVYISLQSIINEYKYSNNGYVNPFIFRIVEENEIKHWGKQAENVCIQLNDLKVLI